jgi:hypothetical protein
MSMHYLPEHAQVVVQSLALARKEAEHLRYSQTTLFALPIDLTWVQDLGRQPVLAEKVEAFVSRFGRLQDHLGEKLLPRYAALVGESPKTFIDTLAFAERAEVLSDADAFIAARKLRNALVHEYMHDAQFFLESLQKARQACELFFGTIDSVAGELQRLGVPQAN